MPVNKKQHTTSSPGPTVSESSSPQEVVQQGFHEHLRAETTRCSPSGHGGNDARGTEPVSGSPMGRE